MIYLIGDCLLGNSFYTYNRQVKNASVDIDIKWAWAGTRMRYLLEPEHRGFILEGFIEWAATHDWQPEDCLLMSVGISDLRALNRVLKKKALGNKSFEEVLAEWIAKGPTWIKIYSQFIEQYIEPIPIDSLQKGLMWVPWPWKKGGQDYALPLWKCLNKGIKSLAEDYNYRHLYLERPPTPPDPKLKTDHGWDRAILPFFDLWQWRYKGGRLEKVS